LREICNSFQELYNNSEDEDNHLCIVLNKKFQFRKWRYFRSGCYKI